MRFQREPMLLRNNALGRLDLVRFEFNDLAASDTDEMVVVMMTRFVTRQAIIEMPLFSEPRVHQEFHGAVDRRVPDPGIVVDDGPMQLLARDMPALLEKSLENDLSLTSSFELILFEVFGKNSLFEVVRHTHKGSASVRQGLLLRFF